MRKPVLLLLLFLAPVAHTAPLAPAGDMALRHDIQVLADYGAVSGPITTWPISWDALLQDLERVESGDVVLPNAVMPTYKRLFARAQRETARGENYFGARVSAGEDPILIRSFEDTPREDAEARVGYKRLSDHFTIDLKASWVNDPADGDDLRADGSQLAADLGNWSFAASTLDRWWGPGWGGSLILSNNARPIPALTFGRNRTGAFKTKWLSWIGPWDFNVIWGQLGDDRAVPNTRLFGSRLSFRPIRSLEIGISRTAQWCGSGRPCGFDTFLDMLFGRDNVGDDGATDANEPGNQMAGFDARWTNMWFGTPVSIYAQAIGEDEAGGFPSLYLAQYGIEGSGFTRGGASYRWYAELAGTSCGYVNENRYNCAYRNEVYPSGYTYNGHIIGHSLDNDAQVVTAGLIVMNDAGRSWHAIGRWGDVNRGGAPQEHAISPIPVDLASLDLQYNFETRIGLFQVGLGYERFEYPASGETEGNARGFLRWQSR